MADNLQTIENKVTEIYISTVGRAPDAEGLAYWTEEILKGNLTLEQVNESFFDQSETQELYAGATDEEFLASVYQNVLGREPDQGGYDYWMKEFDEGKYTHDSFIQTLINGAKAETGDANDATLLQNKVNVAIKYAKEVGVADSEIAKQVIKDVGSDSTSAEEAMALIDFNKGWVDKYAQALGDNADIKDEDLWKHIDDKDFWESLEQEHDLAFDEPPEVKFWELTDDVWADDVPNKDFEFLKDESLWHDPAGFEVFDRGEYANIDPDELYQHYSDKTADMYADFIRKDVDAELLNRMFNGMDDEMQGALVDPMFMNMDDADFATVLGNVGSDGMQFFDGVPEFDFDNKLNQMDDQYVADILGRVDSDGLEFLGEREDFNFDDRLNHMDDKFVADVMGKVDSDGLEFFGERPDFDFDGRLNQMDDQYMAEIVANADSDELEFFGERPKFDFDDKMNNLDEQYKGELEDFFDDGMFHPEFGENPPPSDGGNPPPFDGGNPPPFDGGNPPPFDGGNPPPFDGGNPPPFDGGNPPPSDGGNPPPSDGGNPPPSDGGNPPPSDGGNPPPADAPPPPQNNMVSIELVGVSTFDMDNFVDNL